MYPGASLHPCAGGPKQLRRMVSYGISHSSYLRYACSIWRSCQSCQSCSFASDKTLHPKPEGLLRDGAEAAGRPPVRLGEPSEHVIPSEGSRSGGREAHWNLGCPLRRASDLKEKGGATCISHSAVRIGVPASQHTCSITTSIESLSSMSSFAGVSSAPIFTPSYRNLI